MYYTVNPRLVWNIEVTETNLRGGFLFIFIFLLIYLMMLGGKKFPLGSLLGSVIGGLQIKLITQISKKKRQI